jgi:hypothetical protein
MDKLSLKLREDADKIEVRISDELDHRIEASLRAAAPADAARRPVPRARPPWFWLASALTGATAAVAVIAIVNMSGVEGPAVATPTIVAADPMPLLHLDTEAVKLTEPLQQELEDLQSDLKKAEEKVRRDIGL